MKVIHPHLPSWIVPALLLAVPAPAWAQSFEDARKGIDRKLEASLEELARERDRIAGEKIPLSKAVSKLENEVIALRNERAQLLEVRDSRTIDLSSLRRQAESLEEQEEFINSRLNEFVRDFEGRLDISELSRYEERTAAAKLAEKNVNLAPEGKREAQLAVVRLALERLREQLGGQVFPGDALSPEGVLTRGKFVAVGPSVFYASDDGSVTGIVEHQLNAADPVVVDLPDAMEEGLMEIAATGRGRLSLDATLGKALKTERARRTLAEHIEDGGPVGYVIVALGLVAFLLTLLKTREIMRFPVTTAQQVDEILQDLSVGNSLGAAKRAAEVAGVAGELLAAGVENAHEKRGVLEEVLFERILRVRPTLERFLPFLAITAAAAPLLGLLGTVVGMIKTFQLITIFGTGDAKALSSGISEALVTTEFGLIVAIPTLIVHGALTRMAKHKLGLLEQVSVAFVNGVVSIRHTGERDD